MKAVRQLKTQAGFSLIELMIVVAIIGILASIAVPNFQKFQRRAKQTEGKGYLAGVYSAEQGFRAEWNSYSSDLRCIGFKDPSTTGDGIAGKGNYRVGFATDGIPTITGTMCAAGGNVAAPIQAAGTTIPAAAPAGTNVSAPQTFLAGASGDLSSGAIQLDNWTINQDKTVANTQSGI